MIFQNEQEVRDHFEKNLSAYGVKRIILSQEPCPDYVVEMNDGSIAKVEAELFAINFRYHGHDPNKVDFIFAGYSKTEEIDGVRVIAVNRLWLWDEVEPEPIPADKPLSDSEALLLRTLLLTGGVVVSALRDKEGGDQQLWLRFRPDVVAALPRGRDDSVLSVMDPEAKKFVKKYHHAIIGAGMSVELVSAIEGLQRRGLARYRPLEWLAAAYDGGIIDHPAYLPTELAPTDLARSRGLPPARPSSTPEQSKTNAGDSGA